MKMFCTYCKVARVENEAPCPNCGAPSPLLGRSQDAGWGTAGSAAAMWDSPAAPSNDMMSNIQWDQVPQLPFDAPAWSQPAQPVQSQYWSQVQEASPGWPQSPQSPQNDQAGQAQYWSQVQEASPIWSQSQAGKGGQPSLLPVPYQDQMGAQLAGQQYTIPLQLVPEQALEHLLPASSAEAETVYVPPMYTQPRAIIPRYRVISGFISLVVVVLLLCSGAGYYANATGTVSRILNGNTPPNIKLAQAPLPDPPEQADKDRGPAYNIIPSATTALRVNKNDGFAVQEVKVFKPGQPFFLTFTVHAPANADGKVTTKWYTDQRYFRTVPTNTVIKAGDNKNGDISMVYQQASEGMVELYWSAQNKDQFAQRIYFVVRP